MPRTLTAFRIDDDLLDAMQAVKSRDGVPLSAQVRIGIRLYLEQRGALKKTDRKRAATRKRS